MRIISERGNLWELAVLSMVREEPMHPYRMQRLLQERHKDEVLELKRGSLYHAIHRLARAGLIEPMGVRREGRRPERTVYRMTSRGRPELMRWLRERIATPQKSPSEFMGSLSFLVHLSPNEARTQLEIRAGVLRRQIVATRAVLQRVSRFVGRINLVESEYSLAMARAELRWVTGCVEELRRRKLTWDLRTILRQVRAARRRAESEGKRK